MPVPDDMETISITLERRAIERLKELADADQAMPLDKRRFTARGKRRSSAGSVARRIIVDRLFSLPECSVDNTSGAETDRAA